MSTVRPIQPTFASGEVSPEIYSRVDIAKYSSALRKCRNFIIHPTGGASNRPGTRYVADAKFTENQCVVQEFIFSQTQKYVLEIGHEYIRFFTAGAQINVVADDYASWNVGTSYLSGDYVTYNGSTVYFALTDTTGAQPDLYPLTWAQQTIYEVPTPYQSTDLDGLRFETSGDTIFITHPDYQTRLLQRFGETDWRISLYSADDGPFMAENIDDTFTMNVSAVSGSGVTLTAAQDIFANGHVGALFKLRHYVEGQTATQAFGSATTGSAIRCFTTWRVISHGTWTGTFKIEKSTDGGTTWTVLRTFSSVNDFNANTSGTEDIETNPVPFLVRINFSAWTSGTANIDLTTDAFYQEGIIRLTSVSTTKIATGDMLQSAGATTNTSSWNEGSWSDYRGWPSVCRFYQDRLVFAGTYTEPMTLWMTQTSNYYSFFRHSTLLDTDGITARLPSRQLNAVNGLVAFKRLLVFTSASIWSVGPVSGSAMTPTGYTTEIEEYNGSNGINPAVIGNEAIYLQEHGHVVSNIGFALATDSFTGSDANVLASHLFDKWEIVDIAYQRNPDRIVWMLRSDGKMVGMTYMRDQEVVAFHWHDTGQETSDQFKSFCVVPSDGFDEVWFSVSRENGIFIERMVLRMESSTCSGEEQVSSYNQLFMDSAVTFNEPINIEDISVDIDGNITITSTAHGLVTDDVITISCAEGMNEINNRKFKVIPSSGGAGFINQLIMGPFGSVSDTQPDTSYHPLNSGNNNDFWDNWTGSDTYAQFLVTKAGALSDFRTRWAGPSSGKTVTLTVMKNGVATALAVSQTGFGTVLKADTTNSVSVVPGDLISVRSAGNDTASATFIWSVKFTGSDAYSSIHCFGGRGEGDSGGPTGRAPDDTSVTYTAPLGDAFWWATTDEKFIVAPMTGKIKNMYVKLDISPGGGSKGFTYTFRKNSVDTTLSVAITGAGTTGNDTIHEIDVVAGDLISIKAVPANTPDLACPLIGFTFESATAGQFPMFAASYEQRQFPAEVHAPIYGLETHGDSSPDDEQDFNEIFAACTFKSMYVKLDAAPGSGNSKVFTLQKNTVHGGSFNGSPSVDYVDTAMSLTISNASTSGSITTDVALADNDKALTSIAMVSSPDLGRHFISYVVETTMAAGGSDPDSFQIVDLGGDPIDGTGYSIYHGGGQIRPAFTGFTGLDHLEGQSVAILGDGEVLERQIVAGGEISINNASAYVHVGLPYESDFELLNIEQGLRDGTLQGRKVKISNVTFRLKNTRGGYIGPDEDRIYEAFTTANLAASVPIAPPIGVENNRLFNVDVRVPLGAGYEGGGRVFYRQSDPLPVTILAVIPEVTIPNPTVR